MCLRPLVTGAALLVTVAVTSAAQSEPVRHLTVTSKDGMNVLQWVNPAGFGNVTIRYDSGPSTCVFPSLPEGGDGSLLAGNVSGTADRPASFRHEQLTNTHNYCYTVWVNEGPGFSAGRSKSGRPFSTSASANSTRELSTKGLRGNC